MQLYREKMPFYKPETGEKSNLFHFERKNGILLPKLFCPTARKKV
jgi:hypothetical protein